MMSQKRKTRLPPDQLVVILHELAATGEVVPSSPDLTFRALGAMPRHGLSFWDALVWSAAIENKVVVIYTEDFQDGRIVE